VQASGDRLTVCFAQAGVTAVYKVTRRPQYIALELVELAGKDVHHIDLLRLTLKRPPYLGTWLNTAYDDRFGVCLSAGNLLTDAQMEQSPDRVTLKAGAERQSGLVGAKAVLVGCHEPGDRFLDTMEIVERELGLPSGAAMRRSPLVRYSYLWAATPTPENIDRYVDWAKRAGLRMLLFSYTAFSRGAGHFVWNDSYPQGMADLKKVTDVVRRAGLELGLHIHYCKARKNDPYVTPVPDDRLHKERVFALAGPVDAAAPTIPVRENPAGCTLDKGRRILQIGKELIAYRDYSTEAPFELRPPRTGRPNGSASWTWTPGTSSSVTIRTPTSRMRPPHAWPRSFARPALTGWSISTGRRTCTRRSGITSPGRNSGCGADCSPRRRCAKPRVIRTSVGT
jgi:hypothetical protein